MKTRVFYDSHLPSVIRVVKVYEENVIVVFVLSYPVSYLAAGASNYMNTINTQIATSKKEKK